VDDAENVPSAVPVRDTALDKFALSLIWDVDLANLTSQIVIYFLTAFVFDVPTTLAK
jgi:hypothetical protein